MDRYPRGYRAFHPKDPAHGALNFDIGALNKYQKRSLNFRKLSERNQNEIYLNAHPEIKGLISIVLRHVLREQPSAYPHEIMGEFYNRPRQRILEDLAQYFMHTEQVFAPSNELEPSTCK